MKPNKLGISLPTFLCLCAFWVPTWRVGGLTKSLFYRVISTITPIRAPFRVLISLLTTYLLNPPTLQVIIRLQVVSTGWPSAAKKGAACYTRGTREASAGNFAHV